MFIVGCSSGDDDGVDTRRRCEQLRDHMIDMRLGGLETAAPSQKIDVAAHRAAMMQALGESFLSSCQTDFKPKQLDCALAAPDLNAITDCSAK